MMVELYSQFDSGKVESVSPVLFSSRQRPVSWAFACLAFFLKLRCGELLHTVVFAL